MIGLKGDTSNSPFIQIKDFFQVILSSTQWSGAVSGILCIILAALTWVCSRS